MSVRKITDAAQISFVVGAAVYLGFMLTELAVQAIFRYITP
ncbi:MAG: hypothetical protein OEV49_13365 [candidate division Zixibacteria bacterium]|nr:hypothetical protein [candidate division Zixibacteria bacterium]MDH3938338.1 hypothetical protein [candidate division Zixibacteria bacterium]MDH4035692.1 hypothetical protein [candidate division Zixibacteria bacterium]